MRRNLAASEADVEGPNTSEELSFLLAILPVLELPVLTVNEHGNNSGPARLSEVGDAIVDVKCYLLRADASCDLYDLLPLRVHDRIAVHSCLVLIIDTLFEEALHVR